MSDAIGYMDRRIIVQQPTDSRDDFGGITTTWGTYVSRWANIFYSKKAGENYDAARKTSMYNVLFTLRADAGTRGVNTKMRILYEGIIYDIRAISERADEFRRMYLTIEAEQKGPDDGNIAAGIGDESGAGANVWGWVQ